MTNNATIDSSQIMQLLEVSESTAQDLLNNTCRALGKQEKGPVSVTEFCHINKLDEEEVRHALLFI